MAAKPDKRWKHRLIIIAMTLAVVFAVDFAGGLQRLEWMSFDWRSQLLREQVSAPDDIAVILIDEAAISAMNPVVGRWPWPRSVHADVVDFLTLGQPRAVLFDILFTENEEQAGEHGNVQSISPHDQRLIDASRDAGTSKYGSYASDHLGVLCTFVLVPAL